MLEFLRSRLRSFAPALAGWWYVLRTQRNAWVHALASAMVFVLAWWLQLGARDWALLVFAVGLVWTTEFINTALEALVDLHSPEQHPLAKTAKDVGAAAVLAAALAAVVIGVLVLGPGVWEKVRGLINP